MNKEKCKEIFNKISPKPPTENELCDKASHHCYDLIYPDLLEPYFNKKISLLEIGVYRGGSMLIWKEVFPDSKLTGVDWDYKNLKPYINKGGIYIIEDIYPDHFKNKKYPKNFLDYFELIDYTPKSGRGDDKLLVYKN